MKRVFLFACLVVSTFVAGCGGGLDSNKQLSKLDDSEAKTLCADAKVETKDCGNGLTITTQNAAQCELAIKSLPDTCTATVANYDDCDAVEPCAKLSNTKCAQIAACALSK